MQAFEIQRVHNSYAPSNNERKKIIPGKIDFRKKNGNFFQRKTITEKSIKVKRIDLQL